MLWDWQAGFGARTDAGELAESGSGNIRHGGVEALPDGDYRVSRGFRFAPESARGKGRIRIRVRLIRRKERGERVSERRWFDRELRESLGRGLFFIRDKTLLAESSVSPASETLYSDRSEKKKRGRASGQPALIALLGTQVATSRPIRPARTQQRL